MTEVSGFTRPLALAALTLSANATGLSAQQAAGPIAVPSGQQVAFAEFLRDPAGVAGLTYRFRFVAPGIARIGGSVDIEAAGADMEFLCRTFALPRVESGGETPAQVVISLADRPTEFGVPTPEATQFFEAFAIEDGQCVWERF